MRIKTLHKTWISIGVTAGLLALVWVVGTAVAQGPDGDDPLGASGGPGMTESFTYQGRLQDEGEPANGFYDFFVELYGSQGGQDWVADCINVNTPSGLDEYYVQDGLFTFHLVCSDWNGDVFTGENRWVQVWVRPSGPNPWIDLPRQAIAPTPYAWSLRPGAVVRADYIASPGAVVAAENYGGGFGLYGYGGDFGAGVGGVASGDAVGLYGMSHEGPAVYGYSNHGAAGYFYSYDDEALWAFSGDGPAGHYQPTAQIHHRGSGAAVRATSQWGAAIYATGYEAGGSFVGSSGSYPALRAENNSGGNLIEAWSGGDRQFRVTGGGEVYADGGYHCGKSSDCWWINDEADFAEVLPIANDPGPGDLLIIDASGRLAPSTEPYQTNVVGVYSTRPMVIGNSENLGQDGYAPLAVAGIVPAKASAENGPIHPGDLLTTSSTPGHAMLADQFVGGAIVGKALEGLDAGTGVIRMLVMLQ